jgi:DNA polymerase elongation subunit (family B)
MTKHTEFTNALEAQEFYLKQSSPMYWHLGFNTDSGRYTLDYLERQRVSNKITKIEYIGETEEYLYDLETESGVFCAGVGCMDVHNTDSVYVQFSHPSWKDLETAEKYPRISDISNQVCKEITGLFKPPIELEFEKFMCVSMLLSKKRYVILCVEAAAPITSAKIDAKGVQIVRRDNCPYVKTISTSVLEKLMFDKDVNGAVKVAKRMITDLIEDKVDPKELVLSKSLKAHYNDENKDGRKIPKPAHWHLAQKIKERNPMEAPQAGDRVAYVFVRTDKPKKETLQADIVESPEIVREQKLEIDSDYYLEHQIQGPLETIFSVIVKDKHGELYPLNAKGTIGKECKKAIEKLLWANAKRKKANRLKNQREIDSFFKSR